MNNVMIMAFATGTVAGFAAPEFDPNGSSGAETVDITGPTGCHLFFLVSSSGTGPTHSGDTATGGTTRVASNFTTTAVASGKWLACIAYIAGRPDSPVTKAHYGPA